MKTPSALALIALVLATASARADTPVTCLANGKVVSHQGYGVLPGRAKLQFIATNFNGAPALARVHGVISAQGIIPEAIYTGYFQAERVVADARYNPRKYKGYVQFRDFNAVRTRGWEDGMWGELVVEADMTKPEFQAHYIFKAGDHMGGTLHMICHAVR